jgi:hypothetical protein
MWEEWFALLAGGLIVAGLLVVVSIVITHRWRYCRTHDIRYKAAKGFGFCPHCNKLRFHEQEVQQERAVKVSEGTWPGRLPISACVRGQDADSAEAGS